MLRLYALATTLAWPLIRLWLKRRAAQGKEDASRFSERLGRLAIRRPEGRVIWIHAASVGESLSVLPLLERLHDADDSVHIVLTTGTVSSAALIRPRLPERAYHHYVPVDVPHLVRRFLRNLKPDVAIWVESEFWPNLMRETHRRDIPMLLVNARISARSQRRWGLLRGVFGSMMSCFSHVYAGSKEDKQALHQLGVASVQWAGNLKYDAAPLPADPEQTSRVLTKIGDRHVWLASSTHEGEEALIIEAHKAVREVFPDVLTILVPRHPERAKAIAQQLASAKLTVARRSKAQVMINETDVYLADTLGELGIFYRLAGLVFVGGSLVPHGGHNPIEPAQLDCAILCGQHMYNFAGVVELLESAKAIRTVPDAAGLSEAVIELLRDHEAQDAMAARAHQVVDLEGGASEHIAMQLLEMLGLKEVETEQPSLEAEEGGV